MLPILVLPTTVVGMQLQVGLSEVVGLEEMVYHADNGVGSFPCLCGFIYQVVNLLVGDSNRTVPLTRFSVYLAWYSLAAYTKDGAFPGC